MKDIDSKVVTLQKEAKDSIIDDNRSNEQFCDPDMKNNKEICENQAVETAFSRKTTGI